MSSDKKRRPVRRKLWHLTLAVTIVILICSTLTGAFCILQARDIARNALASEVQTGVRNMARDRAELADSELQRYLDYVSGFTVQIQNMYEHPENYVHREPMPYNEADSADPVLRIWLRDEKVDPVTVDMESGLFCGLEDAWRGVYANNSSAIVGIFLGTESGLHLALENADYPLEYYDYSVRDWYVSAKTTGKPGYTDFYEDPERRGPIATCYAPFTDGSGTIRGVVAVDVLFTGIFERLAADDISEDALIFLADSSRNTVDPGKPQHLISVNALLGLPEGSNAFSVSDSTGGVGFGGANTDVCFSFFDLKTVDWVLGVRLPESRVMGPVNQLRAVASRMALYFMLLTLGILLLSIPVIRKVSRSMTDPLVQLEQDALLISGGDLNHRSSVSSNDELGDLADSFNRMTENLQRYISDLSRLTSEQERINAELGVASRIQEAMLPRVFPPYPDRRDFDIYADVYPSREVSGDFYDFFLVDDDHLALVIADVSGRGVPSALFMSIVKALIKILAKRGDSPAQILSKVNTQICKENRSGMYVSVWIGIVRLSDGRGLAASAGHQPAALRRSGSAYALTTQPDSPAVSVDPNTVFPEYELELAPGDSLFLYTRGVADALNPEGQSFGTARLLDALNSRPDADPRGQIDAVRSALVDFARGEPQQDDMAVLCFRRNTPESAS